MPLEAPSITILDKDLKSNVSGGAEMAPLPAFLCL